MRKSLSSKQARYMDYFWNSKLRKPRLRVPANLITFFESDGMHGNMLQLIHLETVTEMSELASKGYVDYVENGDYYQLTVDGMSYVKDEHPNLIAVWEEFWERRGKVARFIAEVIGIIGTLIASYEIVMKIWDPNAIGGH